MFVYDGTGHTNQLFDVICCVFVPTDLQFASVVGEGEDILVA